MSEWKTIKKKKGKGPTVITRTHDVRKGSQVSLEDPLPQLRQVKSCDTILSDLRQCMMRLEESEYFRFVGDKFDNFCGRGAKIKFEATVALGVGCLNSDTSILQLAMYLCLCDRYLRPENGRSRSIFDPYISEVDRKVYNSLGIVVMTENLKGKHRLASSSTATSIACSNGSDNSAGLQNQSFRDTGVSTLFFMPHCPYRLYCNLLWANWEHLDQLYIFGNSFNSYSFRRMNNTYDQKEQSTLERTRTPSTGCCVDAVSENPIMNSNGAAGVGGVGGSSRPTCSSNVDPTDTIELLLPYISELNLWPSATGGADGKLRDRILKEAQNPSVSASLYPLENAFCDLSLMHFETAGSTCGKGTSGESSSGSSLSSTERPFSSWCGVPRPTETAIDEAAALDPELF
mmetsp:Transcript_10196/g.16735  ORF Transcript_10196/g.16735 Transcript_10196/m.16735 type:complete len:402 (-) Transcript_10196:197-1402(-)|eukprot:CAMPEP_0174977282 /NCGR_PEP_ID=MMETSP0004_2-20121128/13518_1 /TAXON_ID=420556 /ORGANISM="Ochromonas sp., Strain CCMP1393" /LENGTH=401 /DNA_ID=CAMNT_0016228439 /DNA_START=15 /DNA_END=1220 /DNA_ORIENTATION=+